MNAGYTGILSVEGILEENARRQAAIKAPYDPVAGDSADPGRRELRIPGLSPGSLWIPEAMESEELVASLRRAGSVDLYIRSEWNAIPSEPLREKVCRLFARLRVRHDFPYWAASYVYIKRKGGGADTLFVLNRPQRRLVKALEEMRTAGLPLRLIILKARQWGGSTCVQLYMSWLQLVHSEGLNSLIIAHQAVATDEIKDMFDRMLKGYPGWLLAEEGEESAEGRRMENVGIGRGSFRVPGRNFKVKLGTAERPDSCRGGDYNLVHLSEVGLWRRTALKTPEQIMRSACSGVLLEPLTMIVFESTANGSGTFFHSEYKAARAGESQFRAHFVPWYEIDKYSLPLVDAAAFAASLLEGRTSALSESPRRQPGAYLWLLWERGATLEAINWFIAERSKYSDHALMASEYPSDDVEAFAQSGAAVFDRYKVEEMRKTCREPLMRGEIDGRVPSGPGSLEGVHFSPDEKGCLEIWKDRELPEEGWMDTDRYLAVVDVGGRSATADWSVVAVFDRLSMGCGGVPEIVAQWRGHTDADLLAWNAARIAAYYCGALLVIESNSLETRDLERFVDGDQSLFILSQLRDAYPCLYARRQSEDSLLRGEPRRYGFHTNSATKPMVVSCLVKAIREHLYVERDERCIEEYLVYEQRQNGSFGALPGHHDDLLMTRAIGLHICFTEMELPRRVALPGRRRRSLPGSAAVF